MIFWLGGIVEAQNGDAFRHARNTAEATLNALAMPVNQEALVAEINVVFVINQDTGPGEFRRFVKKERALNARVRIAYGPFLAASETERVRLMLAALVHLIENTANPADWSLEKRTLCLMLTEMID
ncbi:Imm44 family immunity protein [Hymenobacter terricola]|uniref:Imm44 family immunity protein n=1 Tax=Hymenobacter terricola TaxID=2819236 RepID=UPI001B307BBA|nr:Imm44 family immunity protein [Hymenobacter terricola]